MESILTYIKEDSGLKTVKSIVKILLKKGFTEAHMNIYGEYSPIGKNVFHYYKKNLAVITNTKEYTLNAYWPYDELSGAADLDPNTKEPISFDTFCHIKGSYKK